MFILLIESVFIWMVFLCGLQDILLIKRNNERYKAIFCTDFKNLP